MKNLKSLYIQNRVFCQIGEKYDCKSGEMNQDYEIIGPIYFQILNKPEGFSPSTPSEYKENYEVEVEHLKNDGVANKFKGGSYHWKRVFGEWFLCQNSFEIAFLIAVE